MEELTIPQAAAFEIQLPSFEGPLDLLLHLIKSHELNVLDLPIAFVTERYLDYLKMMQVLDLDVASEYLLMAATLAHIKSKMLLPVAPNDALEEQEQAYQEDPRAELIRRLLEYQKYKEAAAHLGSRSLAGRDVFQRGLPAPEAQGPAPLASIDLYKLLDAFQAILKRVQGRVALEVTAESITIQERITQLTDVLRVRRSCLFDELFEAAGTRYEVIVTFLALLEMTKLRMTRIYQADPNSALHVQYALLDAESPTIPPDALTADAREVADFEQAALSEAGVEDIPVSDVIESQQAEELDVPEEPDSAVPQTQVEEPSAAEPQGDASFDQALEASAAHAAPIEDEPEAASDAPVLDADDDVVPIDEDVPEQQESNT